MPTTFAEYGRAKVKIPDLNHDGGATLHNRFTGAAGSKWGLGLFADSMPSIWEGAITLGDTATQNFVHNFNLSYTSNQLSVMIWISGVLQTKDQNDTNFVIAQVDANTISVQNVSGSPKTFDVMIFSFPVAKYVAKVLQAIPGAGFGLDAEEAGVLPIGHTLATDLDLGRSGQYESLLGRMSSVITTDAATTGASQTVPLPNTSFLRLTNASLTSVSGITAPTKSMLLIVTNVTGATVNFLAEDTGASAADRIGMDTPIAVANKSTLFLAYDLTSARWRVAGGAGGGAYTVKALQNISASGTISLGSEGFQTIRVQGSVAAVSASTTPFGATPPPDGTVITLLGANSTNTVTILHNDAADGCWLNGDCQLGKGSELTLQYIAAEDRYIEKSRNGILGL